MASSSKAKKRAARKVAAASPAQEVVVRFARDEDPSAEQTAQVHDLVRKYDRAWLVSQFPGALKIRLEPAIESSFRKDVAALPDWDVASEGAAEMPERPLPEPAATGRKKSGS